MFVNIWVTSSCNMACTYCYEGSSKKDALMNSGVANGILEYIYVNYVPIATSSLIVRFHGGEPLLNYPMIEYIVRQLKNKYKNNLMFGITTNLTIADEHIARFLIENFNYNLSFSIDGTEETNDAHRMFINGNGSYDIIVKNLSYFRKYSSRYDARMTVVPESVDKLFNNCVHLLELDFTNIGVSLDYFSTQWNDKHFEILKGQIIRLKKYYDTYSLADKNIYISMLNWNNIEKSFCTAGKEDFNVDVNGDIYPCTYSVGDKTLLLGNIKEDWFINVDLLAKLSKINCTVNRSCDGCKQIAFCISSRCKLVNKALTGHYFKPSPIVCAYQNMIVELQSVYS